MPQNKDEAIEALPTEEGNSKPEKQGSEKPIPKPIKEPVTENQDEHIKNENKREQGLKELSHLIAQECTPPSDTRPFYLFAMDCVPAPRPFAETLNERSIIYSPNPTPGNKPIRVGHQYSLLAFLPEKEVHNPPWILPLSMQRVPLAEKGAVFGIKQLNSLIEEPGLGFKSKLCVGTGDTAYSTTHSRKEAIKNDNLILVTRVSGNRNVYDQPEPPSGEFKRPKWFGAKMNPGKPETQREADGIEYTQFITKKRKTLNITLSVWKNMLFRGKTDFASHKHPFTLIKVEATDTQGNKVFKRPIWIMAQGEQRDKLTPLMIYQSYIQRYDIEHFFRFGKQRLLMDKYQTPETAYEENWWHLSILAYTRLYLAKDIATKLPYPWERYLPEYKKSDKVATPSQVQRDFARIAKETGTPSKAPKQRGISPGRSKGDEQEKRPKQPIIYKTENEAQNKTNTTSEVKKQVTGDSVKPPVSPQPISYEDVLTELKALLPKIEMSLEDFLDKTANEMTA